MKNHKVITRRVYTQLLINSCNAPDGGEHIDGLTEYKVDSYQLPAEIAVLGLSKGEKNTAIPANASSCSQQLS